MAGLRGGAASYKRSTPVHGVQGGAESRGEGGAGLLSPEADPSRYGPHTGLGSGVPGFRGWGGRVAGFRVGGQGYGT